MVIVNSYASHYQRVNLEIPSALKVGSIATHLAWTISCAAWQAPLLGARASGAMGTSFSSHK